MKDKIKQLLGLGIEAKVVSSAVGCAESYVSQLMSDETFAAEVQELRALNLSESAERDSKWNKIETSLLGKLEEICEQGFLSGDPFKLARILAIVNAAKRRAIPQELSANTARPIVVLTIPVAIAAKFVVNGRNQVVEIEGRTVATLPASGVMKKLEELKTGEVTNVDLQEQDVEGARARLDALKKLTHLPVHELV